ncbi:MAG: hypothetical protein ACOYEP_10795 [Limnochordia bacterium]
MSDHPLNPAASLYEETPRDIWQCELCSSDGRSFGHAVAQIVERRLWTVRYLVVYDSARALRVLIPASLVMGVEPGRILCNITADEAGRLPEYKGYLSRVEEVSLHHLLKRVPYWEEESHFLSPISKAPCSSNPPFDLLEPSETERAGDDD